MAFNPKEHYRQIDQILQSWDKILEDNETQIRSLKEVIRGKERGNEGSLRD